VLVAPGGGAWQTVSDARKKTAFRAVDGEALLGRLAALPVRSWQYRAQPASTRHVGPTAQDFRRAFGVGESDTTITTVDADGVALAAAQALERRTRAHATRLAALQAENAALRAELAALRAAVSTLGASHASHAPHAPRPARVAARPSPE
jgi:hypothetical protein